MRTAIQMDDCHVLKSIEIKNDRYLRSFLLYISG